MRTGQAPLQAMDRTVVRFRALEIDEIERYVDAEQPYDCAGSFKSEGLGITLFEAIDSQDPTALIGLPLIATARLLREAGYRAALALARPHSSSMGRSAHSSTLPSWPCRRRPSQWRPGAKPRPRRSTSALKPTCGCCGSVELRPDAA